MKKMLKRTAAALLAVLLALTLIPTFALGASTVTNTKNHYISDALTYKETGFTASSNPQQAYAVEFKPGGDITPVVTYGSKVYGGQTLTGAASDWEAAGNKVVAAVNADFFSTSTGVPLGILITEGKLRAYGGASSVAGFYENGSAFITNADLDITVVDTSVKASATSLAVTFDVLGLNHTRQAGGLYLFDSQFSSTTRTDTEGTSVVLKIQRGDLTLGTSCTAEVESVIVGKDPVELKDGYLVLSADKDWKGYADMAVFKAGDSVTFNLTTDTEELKSAVYATGAGDVIVRNSAVTSSYAWDTSISTTQAPRTAIGVKADGSTVLYCVDGRQSGYSSGLTLQELAQEMISMGCVSAVNLDGGGSTAIGVMDTITGEFTLENKPSNGSQRTCSTYILLVAKNASNGTPAHLHFREDDVCVLAGVTTQLSGVTATDAGYKLVAVPDNVTYLLSGDVGSVTSSLSFTAADITGTGSLTAVAPSGCRGTCDITVIKSPQTITVNAGDAKDISTLDLSSGQTVALSASASHYGRAVRTDASSFSYFISGGIGSITSAGVLTAPASGSGTGTVMVICGNAKKEVTVTLSQEFSDVAKNSWYYDAVKYVTEKGLFNGATETEFAPDTPMTRAMFVTVLGRMAGVDPASYGRAIESCTVAVDLAVIRSGPATTYEQTATAAKGESLKVTGSKDGWYAVTAAGGSGYVRADLVNVSYAFTDIPADAYYAGYVNWAVGKGIVGGYGDGLFGPNDPLTREQLATVLYKYIAVTSGSAPAGTEGALSSFSDGASVSSWATTAMNWACGRKLINGMDDGSVVPQGKATRAQVATILMNYMK